MESHTKYCLS